MHGRYPRGSLPWEERRGQHPDRCNSRTLLSCRICSGSIRSAALVTRSISNRSHAGELQLPESRSLLNCLIARRANRLGWMESHDWRACLCRSGRTKNKRHSQVSFERQADCNNVLPGNFSLSSFGYEDQRTPGINKARRGSRKGGSNPCLLQSKEPTSCLVSSCFAPIKTV